ncbi:hypothetical protein N7468_008804 [Penicillium chermesinum]|uniref:Uncharacterized protein n=1 Tax=Penicillium chermesinum TaxID=63820 RepID=A0A9W9NGK1_9EURO|nr:uncharacterized protein N7468_008804 [Penicillium chermesinum]KAJ5219600.1 hypothetical protein N7468_008804 [Penicillium chermesinum]
MTSNEVQCSGFSEPTELVRSQSIQDTMELCPRGCLDLPHAPEYIGSTKSVITRIVNRTKASTNPDDTVYLKFTNVPPEIATGTDIKATRNFYDFETRCMIITITGGPHERAIGQWNSIMTILAISSNLAIISDGTARKTGNSSHKEPDSQYMPEDQERAWPTVVLEVGYSESQTKLKCDAAWWLANSNGAVNLVITIAIHRTQAQITIECIVLDRTAPPARHARPRYCPVTRQKLVIVRDQNGVITTTPAVPLRITVQEIMARPPLPGETDILVQVPQLQHLAALVWRAQGLTPQGNTPQGNTRRRNTRRRNTRG